ncbi:MAG TPA: DUF4445 domain-containing protein [Desulfuromonadales bacterium]|nr:DUF4445 domain-containing protein [Desulfuromonadales bacterium]
MYAMAIDLGTTTLAASLIDCSSGSRLGMAGAMNPQRRFGADVVSRLDAALSSDENLQEMSALIRGEMYRLMNELCQKTGVSPEHIEKIAIAGNPAMQHILLGLPVGSLAHPPYRPFYTHGTRLHSSELGWDGGAEVYVFPMPGGFVGGDTVAFMNAVRLDDSTLCLDMGTNGEITLIDGDTIWATSAAAGPAFEGGNLSCGMAALPGAISSVCIEGERLSIQVIANAKPTGICGSAVIEVITELLRTGIIETGGRLLDTHEIPTNLASRVRDHQGSSAFVIHRDATHQIQLTQDDIRQVQLAKGAIRAGIDVLAERSRIRCQALKTVILTGSFGAVLQPQWLKILGIFDENMVHITRFVPEGALKGVEQTLTDNDGFVAIEKLSLRFKVVPLSGTPLFESQFIRSIDFPPYPV